MLEDVRHPRIIRRRRRKRHRKQILRIVVMQMKNLRARLLVFDLVGDRAQVLQRRDAAHDKAVDALASVMRGGWGARHKRFQTMSPPRRESARATAPRG